MIAGSGRPPGDGNGNPLQYLAWRIPWTEEPGGLQSMGSQRVGNDRTHTQHGRETLVTVAPSLLLKVWGSFLPTLGNAEFCFSLYFSTNSCKYM